MKKLLLAGNWKSHKTVHDARNWVQLMLLMKNVLTDDAKDVVLCPSFTALDNLRKVIREFELPIKLGGQDVSPFPEGAYTGAVSAKQLKEVASFVIIGHSERRSQFGETEEMLEKKVGQAIEAGLEVIFCVQGKEAPVPEGVTIVAYEPVFAIGSGTPDTPENAGSVAQAIKDSHPGVSVLYGGGVTAENVQTFTSHAAIDGVLVGGASLDAAEFGKLIKNA